MFQFPVFVSTEIAHIRHVLNILICLQTMIKNFKKKIECSQQILDYIRYDFSVTPFH